MEYKLYFLTANGHVRRRLDLVCDDDDAAISVAPMHGDGRAMELWQGKRKVKFFSSLPPPQTAA